MPAFVFAVIAVVAAAAAAVVEPLADFSNLVTADIADFLAVIVIHLRNRWRSFGRSATRDIG